MLHIEDINDELEQKLKDKDLFNNLSLCEELRKTQQWPNEWHHYDKEDKRRPLAIFGIENDNYLLKTLIKIRLIYSINVLYGQEQWLIP